MKAMDRRMGTWRRLPDMPDMAENQADMGRKVGDGTQAPSPTENASEGVVGPQTHPVYLCGYRDALGGPCILSAGHASPIHDDGADLRFIDRPALASEETR